MSKEEKIAIGIMVALNIVTLFVFAYMLRLNAEIDGIWDSARDGWKEVDALYEKFDREYEKCVSE